LPMAQVPQVLAQLHAALAGAHVLAADVSDARAVFRVRGSHAQDVLAKLCPVDFAALAPDEIRRTRAAQAAVALWRSGPQEFTLISFRSVAGYVMDVLIHSARPGSTLGPT
jgi:sarcosine oxidase subunit gamma